MTGVTLRPEQPGDWPAIWAMIRDVAAEGRTYAWPRDLGEDEGRQLWSAPQGIVMVAVDAGGVVVGSFKVLPNRAGPGSHVANASFMVGAAARGLGVGRLLGETALNWARDAGFRAMQFNAVVATNTAAVNLWRSLGMNVVGTVPRAFQHPEHGFVDLLVMHREL